MRVLTLCLIALGCSRGRAPAPVTASDVPAAQEDRVIPRDVPPPPPARSTLQATVEGASTDPPLRALDPTMAVPRWQGQGVATLDVPSADGAVQGSLRAGDMTLRVRGFRAGSTLRAVLEPEATSADGGAMVWRGGLDATLTGSALRGTWAVSAEGGRFARGGTLTPR